jgi:hypothetical protein
MISRVKVLADILEPEEIDFMFKIAREVEKANLDLPVLYAGSGGDVEHAVILGNELIFIDSHLPETTLSEIRNNIHRMGGEIIEEKRIGELGRGGKHVIRFEFCGEIELIYYAEDATKIGLDFLPVELKNGCSVYFVKVPLPKEAKVGSLTSPDSLARALKLIAVGGFYLERECPLCRVLKPEDLGFKKIASGYISALSVHYDAKGNLYRKVKDVENLRELLELDWKLYASRNCYMPKQP